MIGIEFETDNEYKNIYKTLLKGINTQKYDLKLLHLDAYYNDNVQSVNKSVGELIDSQEDYTVIFGNLQIYNKNTKTKRINTYQDFIDSNCEMIFLIVDVYEIEIYFKDNELKTKVLKNIDELGIKYRIKTLENDGRTIMWV